MKQTYHETGCVIDLDDKLKSDWEIDVMALVSDIFSQAFLDIKFDASCMHDMVYASWTRKK